MWLALLLATSASAQTEADAPRSLLDSLVQAATAEHGFPSVVVGVTRGGERTVVSAGTVGGAAPDAHTPYEIGSVSKVLTSLALADAVTQGETTLDTPVADLLGSPVGAHADGPIRLVDLATHTSGLPRIDMVMGFTPGFDMADPYAGYSTDSLRATVARFVPETAPGATYAYSNLGAGLLGYALATRAETSYEDLVGQRVLTPLGMAETWITASPEASAQLAPAHGAQGEPVPWWTWTDASAGAGAWRSTASDMLTLLEAVLVPDSTPLADALGLALSEHHDAGQPQSIGLAWHSVQTPHGRMWWHNGMVGGSAAFVAAIPDANLGVVVLANRQSGAVDALAQDVLRLQLGL